MKFINDLIVDNDKLFINLIIVMKSAIVKIIVIVIPTTIAKIEIIIKKIKMLLLMMLVFSEIIFSNSFI